MNRITNRKLQEVQGGEITAFGIMAVSAVVIFLSGIIKGYTNPGRCNNE